MRLRLSDYRAVACSGALKSITILYIKALRHNQTQENGVCDLLIETGCVDTTRDLRDSLTSRDKHILLSSPRRGK